MLLEDFYDTIDFREFGKPPPRDKWCDDLRMKAGIESFRGLG